ncbi:MAG: hypothetical protein J5854_04620 [Clostridia bacterium]|nr:hypothetical protein [Clostridia bacterium]
MKKTLCLILAAVLVFSMSACSKIGRILDVLRETEAPESTAAPAATDAPSVTETPAVTEDPTPEPTADPTADPSPAPGSVIMLEESSVYCLDLDDDGLEDQVTVTCEMINEWNEHSYTVRIIRGADPGNPFEYLVDYCYDFSACILDSYAGDSRVELLISFAQDSDDWTSCGFRVNDEGTAIDMFIGYFCVTEDAMRAYTAEQGFRISTITDIWGTHLIESFYKVGQFGFDRLTLDFTYYTYINGGDDTAIVLLRPLEAFAITDEGIGNAVTIPAGEAIFPVRTDNATYVIMKVASTGRLIRAEVEFHNGGAGLDDWGIFISGVNQNEYAELMYAD